jgi:hypothetical protein
MEEEVERPVCRTLFRQASEEVRLDPADPSDSEDSEYEDDVHSKPRVIEVLVKTESAVKTKDQSTLVEPNEGAISPTNNDNESSTSETETGQLNVTRDHEVDQRRTQEKNRSATFHETELQEQVNISVVEQERQRPETTDQVKTERCKQDDTTHNHQIDSVGTLKGKKRYTNKC